MKVFAYDNYGSPDVLHPATMTRPVPGPRDVLVRVHATTVTAGDRRLRSFDLPRGFASIGRLVFGVTGPRKTVLGSELAGTVVEVGKDVTRFAVGQAVFANTDMQLGCYAEYKCLDERGAIAGIPDGVTFAEAATLSFGPATALIFLRKAVIAAGARLLINGAAGGIGSAAVQISRRFGADVTAVTSTRNLELVSALGAHTVIDYAKANPVSGEAAYDIILDAVGNLTFDQCRKCLRRGGRLALVAADLASTLLAPAAARRHGMRVIVGPASATAEDLRFIGSLVASGAYRPLIDRVYAFEDMRDAHRHVDTGRKRGNVVVQLVEDATVDGSGWAGSERCDPHVNAARIKGLKSPASPR